MKPWLRSTIFYCLGVIISTLCAIVLAQLYTGTDWKIEGPVLFAITLVILASHFGSIISVPGSVAGAAVFAFFLYNPENSFRVNNEADRSTLGWMILTSIALSYLLYPTSRVRAAMSSRELRSRSTGESGQIGHTLGPEIGSPALPNDDEIPPSRASMRRAADPVDTGCEVGHGNTGGRGRG